MNKNPIISSIRRLCGKIMRKTGFERSANANPFFICNALGHKLYPSELGVSYKRYDNHQMSDYKFGDIAYLNKIKKGSTVVDIGANVGFYTLLLARQVGSTGKVFSFEPGMLSYATLGVNVAINGYNNVTLINKAVADKSGKTKFYLCRTGDSDNRLQDVSTPADERVAVDIDVVSIDEYFARPQNIDFIKMDIQGSEYLALQGMKNIITNNPHLIILTEYSPHCLESAGVAVDAFLRCIRSFGFKIYLLWVDREMEEVSDEFLFNLAGKGKPYSYVDLVLQRVNE